MYNKITMLRSVHEIVPEKINLHLKVNEKSVNAKAVMQIMSACIKCGSTVEIVCDGADEQAVLDEIAGMFESGFGE